MALDLTKKSPRLLGRGRVPPEIRRRMQQAEVVPVDRGFHETRHTLSDQLTKDSVREMLQQVGGRWDNPRVWKPRDPVRRREVDAHRGTG